MLEVSTHEEQQSLLPAGVDGYVGAGSSRSGWVKTGAMAATAAVVLLLALGANTSVNKSTHPFAQVLPSTLDVVASSASLFGIKTSNEYGDVNIRRAASGAQDYPFLNGAFMIEPHKTNVVEIYAATAPVGEVEWALSQDDSIG
jgi:hypothetical protein